MSPRTRRRGGLSFGGSGRRTRRRDTPAFTPTVLKGVATLGLLAVALAFAVTANKGVPGRDYHKMYVSAEGTGSLRSKDKVAIGGVRVGQVVEITPREDDVRVQLQLEPDVRLSPDTTARIRANGLLGARYVQLIPGNERGVLEDESTIKAPANALSSTVPDALELFNAETRGALGISIRGLGEGVTGNGQALNAGIRLSSDAARPFAGIMQAILAREGAAARLAPSLDSGVTALNSARSDLRRLFDPAADALQPFADERDKLRETLDVAPAALASSSQAIQRSRVLLTSVRALADSAQRTLPLAPNGLRQATKLLQDARAGGDESALGRATDLLDAAEPAIPAVLGLTEAVRPVLPKLDTALAALTPAIKEIGEHGCDVINTGITLRSMTGFVGTGTGPNGPSSQFRLQAVAGPESLGIKDPLGVVDPYPEPCTTLGRSFDVTPGTGLGGR